MIQAIFQSLTAIDNFERLREEPMGHWFAKPNVRFSYIPFLAFFFILVFPFAALSQHSPKLPFPYGPMGLNSMPWIVAKEANLFEKSGLNVDMIFDGVSTVMVQSML